MGSNVYGTPIGNETLKGMTEYHDKSISRLDKARVALEMKNAEGKDVNARQFLENVQKISDNRGILCLFYNATGSPLTLAGANSTNGDIGISPYPSIIENGQWGAFFHCLWTSQGSVAQVVYTGKNKDGAFCEWTVSWHQWIGIDPNYCYVEIKDRPIYSNNTDGQVWSNLMDTTRNHKKSIFQVASNGCKAYASIGSWTNAVFEVVMTLEGAHE